MTRAWDGECVAQCCMCNRATRHRYQYMGDYGWHLGECVECCSSFSCVNNAVDGMWPTKLVFTAGRLPLRTAPAQVEFKRRKHGCVITCSTKATGPVLSVGIELELSEKEMEALRTLLATPWDYLDHDEEE